MEQESGLSGVLLSVRGHRRQERDPQCDIRCHGLGIRAVSQPGRERGKKDLECGCDLPFSSKFEICRRRASECGRATSRRASSPRWRWKGGRSSSAATTGGRTAWTQTRGASGGPRQVGHSPKNVKSIQLPVAVDLSYWKSNFCSGGGNGPVFATPLAVRLAEDAAILSVATSGEAWLTDLKSGQVLRTWVLPGKPRHIVIYRRQ